MTTHTNREEPEFDPGKISEMRGAIDELVDFFEERQIPFSKVPVIFEGPVLARRDERHDYGEERWIAIGLLGHVPVVVVYTKRGHRIRIISARRANRRERERFRASVLAPRGR